MNKTIKTLSDIKGFTEALGEHPGRELYKTYIESYSSLTDIEKAQHKISQSETYKNYCLAKQYGIQIYNYTQGNI
jgi:hypothetical protein